MSFINYNSKEINCKVIYFGPSQSGKTANLKHIFAQTHPDADSKLLSLESEAQKTLFFDFLPLAVGSMHGFRVRFHLYTVPGHNNYNESTQLILRGIDGIVFVCDSQVDRIESNVESLSILRKNLEDQGYDIKKIPLVIQYNKRDLPNACPRSEMSQAINAWNAPELESVASNGQGVLETLKALSKLILAELKAVNSAN